MLNAHGPWSRRVLGPSLKLRMPEYTVQMLGASHKVGRGTRFFSASLSTAMVSWPGKNENDERQCWKKRRTPTTAEMLNTVGYDSRSFFLYGPRDRHCRWSCRTDCSGVYGCCSYPPLHFNSCSSSPVQQTFKKKSWSAVPPRGPHRQREALARLWQRTNRRTARIAPDKHVSFLAVHEGLRSFLP